MLKGFFSRYGLAWIVSLFLMSCGRELETETLSNSRIIDHAAGQTVVPEKPQRIVTLDYAALEGAIALGVTPIATIISGNLTEQPPYLNKHLEGVESLGLAHQANLEKIAQLKPDLIIGCKCINADVYEQLSQIAPTVMTETTSDQWKENLFFYGNVLGKSPEAKEVFAKYQERVKRLQANEDLEVSVARLFPSHVRLYLKTSFSGQILTDLGFSRPPTQDQGGYQQEISKEKWQLIDGDVLFVITIGSEAERALEQVQQDPLWANLEVVKRDRVYPVPGYWVGSGILAAHEVLDDIHDYMLEKSNDKYY